MNINFTLTAGVLIGVIGILHSVIGEILIFQRLRMNGIVPTRGSDVLRERQVRILWASWHVVTMLALAVSVILIQTAHPLMSISLEQFIECAALYALLGSALLVLVGTKAKHPAWIGLLLAALLLWL